MIMMLTQILMKMMSQQARLIKESTVKGLLNFLVSNWRVLAALTVIAYAAFLGYKVRSLARDNDELRQRLETEEKISAAAETEYTEMSSLLHTYYESRIDALRAAQRELVESKAAESARFETEVKELGDRQRRFYRQLRELGESDPEALTCELSKKFNIPGCVK